MCCDLRKLETVLMRGASGATVILSITCLLSHCDTTTWYDRTNVLSGACHVIVTDVSVVGITWINCTGSTSKHY